MRASVSARADCATGASRAPRAAARIRSRVSGATPGRSLTANETAAGETPARRATSAMVGRRRRVRVVDRVLRQRYPQAVSCVRGLLKRFREQGRKRMRGSSAAVLAGALRRCCRAGRTGGATSCRPATGCRTGARSPRARGPTRSGFEDGRLLRQRLAHHRRDGRRLDAAAEAARRRLVRRRRPVGRPGDAVHQRPGLHPLRPAAHGGAAAAAAPTSCPTAARRAVRARADQPGRGARP